MSAEIDIWAPDLPGPPSAPTSVKAYLDALKGVAYEDDRMVGHLLVRRRTRDHPYLRRLAATGGTAVHEPLPRDPSVRITLMPLRVYTGEYDRAFRLRHELERADERDWWRDAQPYWEDAWDDESATELEGLWREREQDAAQEGVYGFGEELAQRLREFRESRIQDLTAKLLLDQRPQAGDRPGPPDPVFHGVLNSLGLDPLPYEPADLPGAFRLSLPFDRTRAGAEAWKNVVRREMTAHRARWGRSLPEQFEEPIALDIAIRGDAVNPRDLDNLAHDVLVPFEEQYCGNARGTVSAYRAYRAEGEPGVRVLVMTERRLRELDYAIDATRHYLLERGPRED